MKHVYNIPEIEDYLPRDCYSGNRGYVQGFLDSLSYAIYKPNTNKSIDTKIRLEELKWINNIRNIALLNRERDYTNKLFKYYSRKIFNILIEDEELERDKLYYLEFQYYRPQKHPDWFSIELKLRYVFEEDKVIEFDTNKYIEYSEEQNKCRRFNNKNYSILEKLVFEFIILYMQYSKDEEYCYPEILFNTFWGSDVNKPLIELPDIVE